MQKQKKKPDIISETKEEIKKPDLKENVKEEIKDSTISSLEDDLKAFEKVTSDFKTEKTNHVKDLEKAIDSGNTANDFFKLKMFFGFGCFILSGLNAFIFDFMSKYEISTEDMKLSSFEREAIRPYLESPKILEWINKIPTTWIAVVHIEWIFFQKFQQIQKQKKLDNAPLKTTSGKKKKKENE